MNVTVRANAETKRVLLGVGKLPYKSRRAIELGMKELGSNLVKTAQDSVINEPKYGRWYPSGSVNKLPRDNHRASAPKQTPALVSGDYQRGIHYLQRGNEVDFGVLANVPYARYLENGRARMRPRPGLRNSINANARNFTTYVQIALEKQLQQ